MISFACDYLEGAHEDVLRALCETNSEQSAGYGFDAHCKNAADMIRERCGAPNAAVRFFVGGTQVNMTAIAAVLRPKGRSAPTAGTSIRTKAARSRPRGIR